MNFAVTCRALLLAACLMGFGSSGFAQDKPLSFKVALSGANEVPAVETPATGTADIAYDPATRVFAWVISYSGLSSPATMGHCHNGPPTQGGKTPVMVWLTKQGSPAENPIKGEATLTPEQAQQFTAGEWYINIHTQANPGGEIRGQVVPPKG
jgi:CHRD domain